MRGEGTIKQEITNCRNGGIRGVGTRITLFQRLEEDELQSIKQEMNIDC